MQTGREDRRSLEAQRAILRRPFDHEGHDQNHALDARERGQAAEHSREPPPMRAHVVERRDRQHEEERFGIDRGKIDRRGKIET